MNTKISFEINAITHSNEITKVEKIVKLTDRLNPPYYTVNTEIGSSNWQDTLNTSLLLKSITKKTVIPHVAINNKDECELNYIAEQYLKAGMETLFVIRGDKHTISHLKSFNHSIDLIEYYKRNFKEISIISSCHPDFHKETTSPNEEFNWLERKSQLGVNEFICQFCLNSDAIANIKKSINRTITLIPAIFPLGNFVFIERFTQENSIDYPLWIRKTIGDTSKSPLNALGLKITKTLIERYLTEFNRLHYFTLNNVDQIEKIFFDAD